MVKEGQKACLRGRPGKIHFRYDFPIQDSDSWSDCKESVVIHDRALANLDFGL